MTDTTQNDSQYEPLKVALYLRVSSDEQVQKYGLPMQREALEALIKSKGTYPDGVTPKYVFAGEQYVYSEEGVSGTVVQHERPAFARMIEDIQFADPNNKPFDVIAVYKIDRLARRLRILLNIISFFEEYEIKLISANESIDTNTPFGRAILGIIGVIAELEIETIKIRAEDGRAIANKEGRVMGSNAEYGYKKDVNKLRVILKEEADIVKRIFYEFVFEQKSIELIRKGLTNDRIPSPDTSALAHGKRKGKSRKKNSLNHWNENTIRSILRDEVYVGISYYGKTKNNKKLPKSQWKIANKRHKEIVDKKTFQEAQKRLKKRSKHHDVTMRKSGDHTYLLSTLLKCDYCKQLNDGDMHHWQGSKKTKNGNTNYSYKCNRKDSKKFSKRCSVLPIPATEIEEYVVKFIQELIKDPRHLFEYQQELQSTKLQSKHLEKKIAGLRKLINGIPGRKQRLKEQHAEGLISMDQLKAAIKKSDQDKLKYEKEFDAVRIQLTDYEVTGKYITTLESFSMLHQGAMVEIFNDRQQLQLLLSSLIKEIVIYSRETTKDDKIAGIKPKPGDLPRAIPESIQIVLNLPTELLTRLAVNFNKNNPHGIRFGVTETDL